MSKNLFTLIYGDKIHLSPQSKVVKSENFSTLIEARELLDKIKKEVEQYRMQVAKECEELKQRAKEEGFREGFEEWLGRIANLEEEIAVLRKESEKMVIPAALKTAKKIVGKEIELSEDVIVDIALNSLKSVSQHKKIVIYANKQDLEILENNRKRLRDLFEDLESLSIRERENLSRGSFVIETEGGIINAQMENMWAAFETAFENLLKRKGQEG